MPRNAATTTYAEMEEEESDHEDMDDDAFREPKRAAGARKEPGKSSQTRKAQNRQAQREFRQRRLAYVRDLETRVQLLSSPHDDQVNSMRNALCSLMEENKQLRRLCANIAGFVGNQMTNALANTGMAQVDFDAVVSRGETDTMHASFARSAEQYNMTPLEVIFDQTPPTTANTKPSSIDGSGRLSPSTKRKRESEGTLAALPDARHNPASANRPDRSTSASVPPSPFAHSAYPPMHAPFPPHFQPRPSEPAYYAYGLPSPADMASYYSRPDAYTGANGDVAVTTNGAVTQGFAHPAYAPAAFYDGKLPLPANGRNPRETAQPQNGFVGEANPPAGSFEHMLQQELGASAPPLLMQAVQLIGYHLSNRRANSTYPLPTSLLPTSMQASIPHNKLVDGLIWPSMRDRLVANQDRYDIRELIGALLEHVELHSDDILDPANWEVKEPFIRAYSPIIDDAIIEQANYWRRQRGEPEVNVAELGERPGAPRSKSF